MAHPILFLVTGGTFDKTYDEINGQLVFGASHLEKMLQQARNHVACEIRTLMMVDSLLMTDEQREDIVATCLNCPHEKIIITHGTDTMAATAQAIATAIATASRSKPHKPKTIILTGAMIPYNFGSSDGLFNLGSAIAFAQIHNPGVYVTMNGRCFDWDDVRKNRQTGIFECLKEAPPASG